MTAWLVLNRVNLVVHHQARHCLTAAMFASPELCQGTPSTQATGDRIERRRSQKPTVLHLTADPKLEQCSCEKAEEEKHQKH